MQRIAIRSRPKGANNPCIQRTTALIDQRYAVVLLVERKAIGHTDAAGGAVGLCQLGANGVRPIVDGFAHASLGARLEELEDDVRVVVACVAALAAGDDVEFVVGQLERAVDADGELDGALFGALGEEFGSMRMV